MNYPLYNNQFYINDLQQMRDRIDKQIQQFQQNQMQSQMQNQIPQPITQNFQLAPNSISSELDAKYANNIDEVKNTFVIKTGVFVNKDYSTMWIKDATGNVRTFRTEEIIEMDEKDKEIINLKRQIEEMKGMIQNANELYNTNVDVEVTEAKSPRVQPRKSGNAK